MGKFQIPKWEIPNSKWEPRKSEYSDRGQIPTLYWISSLGIERTEKEKTFKKNFKQFKSKYYEQHS